MIWQHFRKKNLNFGEPRTVTGTPVGFMVFCHKVAAIDFLTQFSAPSGPQNLSEHVEAKNFFKAQLLQKHHFHFLRNFKPKSA